MAVDREPMTRRTVQLCLLLGDQGAAREAGKGGRRLLHTTGSHLGVSSHALQQLWQQIGCRFSAG